LDLLSTASSLKLRLLPQDLQFLASSTKIGGCRLSRRPRSCHITNRLRLPYRAAGIGDALSRNGFFSITGDDEIAQPLPLKDDPRFRRIVSGLKHLTLSRNSLLNATPNGLNDLSLIFYFLPDGISGLLHALPRLLLSLLESGTFRRSTTLSCFNSSPSRLSGQPYFFGGDAALLG
jgi:hypothetical protein